MHIVSSFECRPGSTQLVGEDVFTLPDGKEVTITGDDFSFEESGSDGSKIFIAFNIYGFRAQVIFLADGAQYGAVAFE